MPTKEFIDELSKIYKELELKSIWATAALFRIHKIFEVESKWLSGCSYRDDDEKRHLYDFPLPVVTVKGVCEMEISFDKIHICAKRTREDVLNYSFTKFSEYEFYAFGADDMDREFYRKGGTIEQMKKEVRACKEREVMFAFVIPYDIPSQELYEFAKLLRREGFYWKY